MTNKVQLIPVVGLLSTVAIAGYMVVQLNGQAPAPTGDYTKAAVAEVRDAQGRIVLRGQWVRNAHKITESSVYRRPEDFSGAATAAPSESWRPRKAQSRSGFARYVSR